ncbi:MAG: HD domain-containing protein [Bacteroidales bacterium]
MKKYLKNPVLRLISKVAFDNDTELYVVGGYVRDMIMNRPSSDLDIVVAGSGIEFARKLALAIGGNTRVSIFKNFGTAMLHYKDLEIEFVGARKESYRKNSRKPIVENGSIEDDQKRRDFTINTLALGLGRKNYGQLLDPFDGTKDINNKIIRTPLDPVTTFSDDPLRMMRAIRFAAQLNFKIEPATLTAIKESRERIKIVSQERITEEINKIILADKPSTGFSLMDKTGLLEILLPEIHAMKGVDKMKGKLHKDNFHHTIRVLDNLSVRSSDLWLRWAALLHDVGKPLTKRYSEESGWTFHGHEHIGAKMIPGIFRRLKLPLNEKMKYVKKIVQLHLRPISLSGEDITDSAVRRLLYEAGDQTDDLMALCEADITSKNRETFRRHMNNFKIVRRKLQEIEAKDAIRNFQPPVKGDEIMETFGLPQGKEVGVIKKAIKDAILDGVISNDKQQALRFMLEKAKEMGIEPK